jgi:hypothetical protein
MTHNEVHRIDMEQYKQYKALASAGAPDTLAGTREERSA